MNLELIDRVTGAKVLLHKAELPQMCAKCREEMIGRIIAHVEGGPPGWFHIEHVEDVLAILAMPSRARARFEARALLADKAPGDTVIVTRQLLAALDR
jgi:hypothetical protein